MRTTLARALAVLLASIFTTLPSLAGTLKVRVLDGRDGAPLVGAFVQVGPAPNSPFNGNSGLTGADGTISFTAPGISGPQTVTAAATDFARFSVMDAAVDSVTLRLSRRIGGGGLSGPTAELSGTVSNITTQNNDGNFDLAFVYPTVKLADLLGDQNLPIDIPADTVNFPVVGPTVLPGNVVMPSQVEFVLFTFSKPNYHFFVKDAATYDFVALAGRLPISALSQPPEQIQNSVTFREVGVERQIAMNGPRSLTINSDLNLTQNLTVNVPEAPNATTIQVASVADLPSPTGLHTLFLDAKSGLADTQDSFLLSGKNPSGDMADAVPYIAGLYADSSAADLFSAGRVDRATLVLPATRTLGDFFLLPTLAQVGVQFTWSDVARPGITPNPSWGLGSFRIEPISAADSTVATESLWQVVTAATPRAFVLPVLPATAPGGLPDLSQTPAADQIVWDHTLADPAGGLGAVLTDPFSTATRFSRRKVAIVPPATSVPAIASNPSPPLFRIGGNPVLGASPVVLWSIPPARSTPVRWTLTAADGRRVREGDFRASGAADPLPALGGVAPGVYWLRLSDSERTDAARVVIAAR
ncbi:MAG: hypothetical protein U0527_10135 [Candidatus Eisenbacteria bacterium]